MFGKGPHEDHAGSISLLGASSSRSPCGGRTGRLRGPTFDLGWMRGLEAGGVCRRQDACSGEDTKIRTGKQNVAQILAEVNL